MNIDSTAGESICGPIANRLAEGMVAFTRKMERHPVEIGMGFNFHFKLVMELGQDPLTTTIEKFMGVPVSVPRDAPVDGCAFR